MKKRAVILIFLFFCLTSVNLAFCNEKKQDIIDVNIETKTEETDNIEQAAIFYNSAIDLYGQDEIEKSIEYFSRALELKPDFYEAHYNLAQILMSVNKNEEALKSLIEISKIKPDDSENLYNLGRIYFKQGYLQDAYEALKKISVNAPQYDSAKLIINKIESRQDELTLAQKINSKDKTLDAQGRQKGVILANFQAPSGSAVDKNGNIYVASFAQNQIYKITPQGQKISLSKSNLIQGPIGLAVDKDNNVFVANYSANNIIKISPNGINTVFAIVNKPYCMTYDSINNRLYVSEQNTNNLVKFDL